MLRSRHLLVIVTIVNMTESCRRLVNSRIQLDKTGLTALSHAVVLLLTAGSTARIALTALQGVIPTELAWLGELWDLGRVSHRLGPSSAWSLRAIVMLTVLSVHRRLDSRQATIFSVADGSVGN